MSTSPGNRVTTILRLVQRLGERPFLEARLIIDGFVGENQGSALSGESQQDFERSLASVLTTTNDEILEQLAHYVFEDLPLVDHDTEAGAAFTEVELRIELEKVVGQISAAVESEAIPLQGDDLADFESDLESATDQLKAARPNRGVIRAALGRMRLAMSTMTVERGAAIGGIIGGIDIVLRRIGH